MARNPRIRWLKATLIGLAVTASGLLAIYLSSADLFGDGHSPASAQISCTPMDWSDELERYPRKLRADAEVGGMGRFSYTINQHPEPGGFRRAETVHPNVAIPAFGGWLLGGNRGEFGGELVFLPDGSPGPVTFLATTNVEDINKMPFGYVATTGLAHMSVDEGAILLVSAGVSGEPKATQLYMLPAAPRASWLLPSGELLVNTSQGSVLLRKDRSLLYVTCIDSSGGA